MRYFLPIVISLCASFSSMSIFYSDFKGISITSEWTCSGCWSTNPEDATHCIRCGRPR